MVYEVRVRVIGAAGSNALAIEQAHDWPADDSIPIDDRLIIEFDVQDMWFSVFRIQSEGEL
ncbi:MAG: hypothetical protein AB7O52_19420 [Planctomycetota bacterium]